MNCASADKRQIILDATLKLLASSGFHGFSMKQLAKEAGIAAGTIYLYFEDRDALIAELHQRIINAFADATFVGVDKTAPIKDQYQTICRNVWHFCINNRDVTLSKGQFDHLPIEVLTSQRRDLWNNQLSYLSELYEQGRQQESIKPLPSDVLASLSFEPFIQIAVQQLLGGIELTESQLSQILDAGWDAISLASDV